jgi:hypothetical protein
MEMNNTDSNTSPIRNTRSDSNTGENSSLNTSSTQANVRNNDFHINVLDRSSTWDINGKKFSKSLIVFICQVIVLYTLVCTAVYKLASETSENQTLWSNMLYICLGCILPSPKIKKNKVNDVRTAN